MFNELGIDDLIFIILLLGGMYLLRCWLAKIYKRVKEIAKILEHFLKEDWKKSGHKEK